MKKMTKAMLMTALICGTMYCGTEPVHANELDTFTLDEYVVTAARTETKLVDTPANITIVGAEEIESRHYTNVAEVLKDVPGANVLDNGTGTSQKPIYLNGDERVLVLVDGRRVNSDMGLGSGRSSFDLNKMPAVELIERIEVLKGAGGALYGSDAVGGVINVITKKANKNYGKVAIAYGSNGAKDMSAMYSFKKEKTGVTVSASKYEQDYYKYKDAATDNTKRWPGTSNFKNEKVSLSVEQEIDEGSNLSFGYDYAKFEGMGTSNVGYLPSHIEKETKNMHLKYDWTINENDKGYLQYYRNEQDYFNWGNMEEKTNGVDIQQTISTSETNKMVVGSSWRETKVFNHTAYAGENNIENIALFINDSWEFAPSWTLNTGVRYDDHSEVGDETTFSAGLNKKINDNSHIYINWAQIYNAPNTDDLFYYRPGYWTTDDDGNPVYNGGSLGNPNLKPESGDTWTLGYNTKINNKTEVGINYFESDLDDAIDWAAVDPSMSSGDWTVKNINHQEKRGMELTVNHEFNNNLDLTASYTYIRVEEDGKRDKNVIPNLYRLGLRYHDAKWNADLFMRYGSGADTTTSFCKANPAWGIYSDYYDGIYADSNYLTVDLAVTYKANKDLKVFAKCYNLLNEAYAEQAGTTDYSYDCPAQSRRFLIGAEYSF